MDQCPSPKIYIQRLTTRNRGYLDFVTNGLGGQIATPRRWGTTTDSIETLSGTGIGTRKFNNSTFMVGFHKGNSVFAFIIPNFLKSIRTPNGVSLVALPTSHRWGVNI